MREPDKRTTPARYRGGKKNDARERLAKTFNNSFPEWERESGGHPAHRGVGTLVTARSHYTKESSTYRRRRESVVNAVTITRDNRFGITREKD